MPIGIFSKKTTETLALSADFSNETASGVTITSVAWTVPDGITNAGTSLSSDVAQIILSGGTNNVSYPIVALGTSDETTPQVYSKDFVVRVIN